MIKYNEYTNFLKLEEQVIKYYEKNLNTKDLEINYMELFEKIKNFEFICNNFIARLEKSKHKKEILKMFDNEYLNFLHFEELILDSKKMLIQDSFQIYYKFLNNESVKIDDKSDLEYYNSLYNNYCAIMY